MRYASGHTLAEDAMKPLLLLAVLALSACSNPMLSTEMAFGTDGVSVRPTLSGSVGKSTVYVQSN